MSKKLISIVVPAYNEESNLEELSLQLKRVFSSLNNYDFEVIIVENGSKDNSWHKLSQLHLEDGRFRSVQLSKNFTAAGGITAGFQFARGDAAIIMCADLQDPPEKIPLFLEKWEQGYEVVYHVVSERQGIPLARIWASELYHGFMEKLSKGALPRNASVYRLLDRKAYTAFNSLKETNRYFPGLCSWIGFKSIGIEFPRAKRFAGEAKSPFRVVFRLALDGIFSFSYAPLRLISYSGTTLSLLSLFYFLFLVFDYLIAGRRSVPGILTQVALISFFFGVLFLFLGIIGEYLGRIYDEVKSRPNFIVKNCLGIEQVKEEEIYFGQYVDNKIVLDLPLPPNINRNKISVMLY